MQIGHRLFETGYSYVCVLQLNGVTGDRNYRYLRYQTE